MSITPCDTCNGDNGNLKCTKCKCAFYCSQACQKQDWKEHKKICKGLQEEFAKFEKKDASMAGHINTTQEGASSECSICLDAILDQPLALPCSHVFCQSCLMQHQRYMGSHISCPLCRAQLPDGLYQYVYASASHLSSMARRHKDKKAHYSALARKELNAFVDKAIVSPELMTLNAELLEIEESFAESIEASLAILEMPDLIEVLTRTNLTNIIKCHMAQHHYRDAMKYIKDLFKIADDPVKYAYDVRFLFHKASECMYELGSYQESINFGMAAIESNRHYEDVHRCVALSYDALGQFEDAILTMRRAVRYETPWDSAHTQVCQELLDRLVRENEARTVSRVEEITESIAGSSI